MKISPEGQAITNRFFEAIAMLKEQKVIRGLQTFTTKYDINRWNMNTVKKEPDIRVLKPEWLACLVNDYGVSATWLLSGKGGMFAKK